jgi:hypothetical protein
MARGAPVTLLPDAGPLITLAYADALDLLPKAGWSVALVDMVMHELTRNETPLSARQSHPGSRYGYPPPVHAGQ